MVLAFGEVNIPPQPSLLCLHWHEAGRVWDVSVTKGEPPIPECIDRGGIGIPREPGAIGPKHLALRVPKPLNEPAVAGKEEEPGGVSIEAPNGLNPVPKGGRQPLKDRRGSAISCARSDDAHGLIQKDQRR
jgi:hypothetical protein